jgi:Ser/Thr protein kinase RdoA (MazF antagonist)
MVDISSWVKNNFQFSEDAKAKLLRSYTNDVYEIENGNKHLLKIYGEGWRTESEVLWEIELLDYLKTKDVDVAGAVESRNGKKLFLIDVGGTKRFAVMFEWARGAKPESPFSLMDYELLGEATARIHKFSDSFQSKQMREELGIDYLLERPLQTILKVCGDDKAGYFKNYATKLKEYILKFVSDGLDWGVVHTDVTFDNIHITNNREVIFYDFDSGGVGWRAIDLQGWVAFEPEKKPRQTEFIKGYGSVRNISDNDVVASPYLFAANEFWGIGLDLERRILKQGEQAINNYLYEKVKTFDRYFECLG